MLPRLSSTTATVKSTPTLRYTHGKGHPVTNAWMECSEERTNREGESLGIVDTLAFQMEMYGPNAEEFAAQVRSGEDVKLWGRLRDQTDTRNGGTIRVARVHRYELIED